jgi:signal peptidase I
MDVQPNTPSQEGVEENPKSHTRSAVELILIIGAVFLATFGIQAFLIKPYSIPSGSMEPTLAIGQRILVNRIGMSISGPHVGQIVVFHPPLDAVRGYCGTPPNAVSLGESACTITEAQPSSATFVKRVVAGPGDIISIIGGHVIRNGKQEKDSYTRVCTGGLECDFPVPIKVPAGHWFMMGDNRGGSDDSRFWGPVPTKWIIGSVFATYWPLNRIGVL